MAQYGEVRVDYITYTTGTVPTEANATVTVSSLVNNPSFSGDINVEGNAIIEGNLNVSGDSLFESITVSNNSNLNDVQIGGTLTVTGNASVSGDLTVGGDLNASGVTISGFTGLFASGTAAAPSISFEDDTDTGFYLSNTNELSAATNGQQRLIVSRSGTVNVNGSLTAGRNFQQYIELIGNSGGNFVRGVSASGNVKPLVIEADSSSNSLQLKTQTANPIIFSPGGVEKFRMTELGRLGVGVSNPTQKIVVNGIDIDSGNVSDERRGTIHLQNSSGTPAQNTIGNALSFSRLGSGRRKAMIASVQTGTDENQTGLTFYTYNGTTTSIDSVSERVRLDSTGRVFINQTESIAGDSGDALIQAEALVVFSGRYSGNNINPAIITLFKDRNSAIVKDNDGVGRLQFEGFDGTAYKRAAAIDAFVDGTPGSGDMPGRLVFSTTPDGSSTPEGRMYITSSGDVGINREEPEAKLDIFFGGDGAKLLQLSTERPWVFKQEGTGASTNLNLQSTFDKKELAITGPSGNDFARIRIDEQAPNNAQAYIYPYGGNVGIGTTNPQAPLEVQTSNAARIRFNSAGTNGQPRLQFVRDSGADYSFQNAQGVFQLLKDSSQIYRYSSDSHQWYTAGTTSERVRIDASGRLLIGTSTVPSTDPANKALLTVSNNTTSQNIGYLNLQNTATILINYALGRILFSGYGNNGYPGGYIGAAADANWSESSYPTRLEFAVTADGATTATERMRITNEGKVGIGTTDPEGLLDVHGGSQFFRRSSTQYLHFTEDSAGNRITSYSSNDNKKGFIIKNDTSERHIDLQTTNTNDSVNTNITCLSSGAVAFPYTAANLTTANAANVHMNSSGTIFLSTSSAKYKTDIKPIDPKASHALLNIQPVSYRSLGVDDNPDWTWYGFVAEDVEKIDPRLVTYKTSEYTTNEEGNQVLQAVTPEPYGVAYERFIPHLLLLIKEQKEKIASLEARVAALEE